MDDSFIAFIFLALVKAITANARIDELPDYMNPKGTLGTGEGQLPDLPNDPAVGDTYFVAPVGTYDDQPANIGDIFIYGSDEEWHIKKQRYYFANKGLPSQSYGFSSGHVWM